MSQVSRRGTPLVASAVVVAVQLVVVVITEVWTGLFAQAGMPHFVAMFSWGSTFGGFALAVIYLLMSAGALRGLRDHRKQWMVYLACTVGIVVTGAAIFGAVYKVSAPLIYVPYAAIGVFVVGLALSFVFDGGTDTFHAAPEAVPAAEV